MEIHSSLPPEDDHLTETNPHSLGELESLVMAEIEADLSSISDPEERRRRADEIREYIENSRNPYEDDTSR